MSANTLITSTLSAGSNNHTTVSEEANYPATDFVTPGVTGSITLNTGSGGTGSFCVNADGSPDMGVTIKAGAAYVNATPSSQNSQVLRVRAAADYTTYVINANASGSTKYDWIYLSISATNANNPSASADNVASFVTSRSSSNTSDNGSPPTYGLLLAIVTVANGASSITNSNITDRRVTAVINQTNYSNYFALFDFVESGLIWSGDSYAGTLNASMTSGVVWLGGVRLTVGAVTARAFTASKDTYIDLSNASNGTASITYTEVTNNAASPALTAGNLRIGIIVTGASTIAAAGSVNQGQETAILPIASSIAYTVTDSLGNRICPRDPQRRLLGYRQIVSNVTVATSTSTQITGLSCPVIIPANRRVKISVGAGQVVNSANDFVEFSIWDGVVVSGTLLQKAICDGNSALYFSEHFSVVTTPATTSKTYNAAHRNGSGTATTTGEATRPIFIMVELI